jgi:hypothetical protein
MTGLGIESLDQDQRHACPAVLAAVPSTGMVNPDF